MQKDELEKVVETKLKKEIEKRGGEFFKFVSPGNKGVPDRIAILPEGHVYFIELKRPKGGRLAPLQKYQQKRLESLGVKVKNIKNNDEIKAFLEEVDSNGV